MEHDDHRTDSKEQLARLSDAQLRALSDDEFWDAIEPMGLCPNCDDARLVAEASRRQTEARITERGGMTPAFTIICFDQVGEDGTFAVLLEDFVRGVDRPTMVERFKNYQEAAEFVAKNAPKNS